jgi:hypothetical protein
VRRLCFGQQLSGAECSLPFASAQGQNESGFQGLSNRGFRALDLVTTVAHEVGSWQSRARTISHMDFLLDAKVDTKIGSLLCIVVVVLCSRSTNAQSVDPVPRSSSTAGVHARVSPREEVVRTATKGTKRYNCDGAQDKAQVVRAKSRKSCCEDSKLIGSRQTGRYWLEVDTPITPMISRFCL